MISQNSQINDQKEQYDHQVKILMVGETGVGKTCLIQRFTRDEFSMNHLPTIAIDFRMKCIEIQNKRIKMQIWDTAGQERFSTLTTGFFRGSDGIIVCFSLCDDKSFDSISKWMTQIKNHAPTDVKVILVGSKADLGEDRRVPKENCEKMALNFGVPYYECSSKSGLGVEEVFIKMGNQVLGKIPASKLESSLFNFKNPWKLEENAKQKKKCCKNL